MQFKIDENLPAELSELIKQSGYGSSTVFEQQLAGANDSQLADVCQKENRILVTLDTGFADIRSYPPKNYPGIIVLRLSRSDKPYILKIFADVMRLFAAENIENRLCIVEEGKLRIRD
jgi:predicted nuclease of predicted toxin-antitoxin system